MTREDSDAVPVVGEQADAGLGQLGHVGERLALQSRGSAAGRIALAQRRPSRPGPAPRRRRPRCRRPDPCWASRTRRCTLRPPRPGPRLHGLLVLEARLAQVRMQVHQPGGQHQTVAARSRSPAEA